MHTSCEPLTSRLRSYAPTLQCASWIALQLLRAVLGGVLGGLSQDVLQRRGKGAPPVVARVILLGSDGTQQSYDGVLVGTDRSRDLAVVGGWRPWIKGSVGLSTCLLNSGRISAPLPPIRLSCCPSQLATLLAARAHQVRVNAPPEQLKPIILGQSGALRVGQQVLAIGWWVCVCFVGEQSSTWRR